MKEFVLQWAWRPTTLEDFQRVYGLKDGLEEFARYISQEMFEGLMAGRTGRDIGKLAITIRSVDTDAHFGRVERKR